MKPLDCILLICLFGSFSVMLLLAYIAFAADARYEGVRKEQK